MDIKKAISVLRGMKPLICQTKISYDDYLDYDEAVYVVDEQINKYKWHDLRKNPYDLPKYKGVSKPYEVIYDKNSGASCLHGFEWWKDNEYWWTTSWDVIAWREIEPFDEEVKQ